MKRLLPREEESLKNLEDILRKPLDSDSEKVDEGYSIAPSDWFIGPKGSSVEPLRHALTKALDTHIDARKEYFPSDPELKRHKEESIDYDGQRDLLEKETKRLADALKGSVPLASYRNQSHMYWDISTPAIAGYFAGMLYNQNNVAAEASPVTTLIEMITCEELCRMVGYKVNKPSKHNDAWGHITCDGSMANIESMWVARNLKYLPIAFKQAIIELDGFESARHLTVLTAKGTRKRLIELTTWELLNLSVDESINIEHRLLETTDVTQDHISKALDTFSIQSMGQVAFTQKFLKDSHHATPVILVPQTAHYSWVKAATLLGLGFQSVKKVKVDLDGRLDPKDLRKQLSLCLDAQQPVIQVVGILGSTEESAVDPIDKILAIREEMNALGMDFYVHVDGAWGGYFTSMFVPSGPTHTSTAGCFANDHVKRQLKVLHRADSITMDPHKSGFIPYAAGSLCYRNGDVRHIISIAAPVVFHDGTDPNVGVYGVEGSKPGAAATSVYLSHRVIGLHDKGYGEILNQCLFANKLFYASLLTAFDESDGLTVTIFQRTPLERNPTATEQDLIDEKGKIKRLFLNANMKELAANLQRDYRQGHSHGDAVITPHNHTLGLDDSQKADKDRAELFLQLGGDLSIINYSLNFKVNGALNSDIDLLNEFNNDIFNRLSLHLADLKNGKVPEAPLILTSSEFTTDGYGHHLLEAYGRRCGVVVPENAKIRFLISTTQNPWLTETTEGNFIPTLINELKETAEKCREDLIRRHRLG